MQRSPRRAALALFALASAATASAAGPAQATAAFVCHASYFARCHFSVLYADGRRADFVLKRGETRIVEDASPGADRYMVGVNLPPPSDPASCSREQKLRRLSTWCKLGPVKAEAND
jgi:hypothetical protein